ncbi:MAG: hypothetical protein ACC608_12700 [Anaerofustis sp.]
MPFISQILMIASVRDAITSDQSYRNALSQEEALIELEQGKGTHFSPAVTEVFIRLMNRHSV